ncbi:MAG: zinc ribbon domain-containing protein [Dehalococcoidia bacterium]
MQEESKEQKMFHSNWKRLIALSIVMIFLGIISSLSEEIPYHDHYFTGSFYGADLIDAISLSLIVISLLLAFRPTLAGLFQYIIRRAMKISSSPERAKLAPKVNNLADSMGGIIAIAAGWPLTLMVVDSLLLLEHDPWESSSLEWVNIFVHLGFALGLVYFVFRGGLALPSLFGGTTASSMPEIRCPYCESYNPPNAQFCLNCGRNIQQQAPNE